MKYLAAYVAILGVLVSALFPAFMAGMIRGSLNDGHTGTALIGISGLLLVWPLLIVTTIISARTCLALFSAKSEAQ